MKAVAVLLGFLAVAGLTVSAAHADDPDFLAVGAGAFDWNRQKDEGAELRFEYRSDFKIWEVKPFAGVAYSTSGHGFVGGGILMDIYFGRRVVVTPSFGPFYYWGGDSDLDLDYPLEFRSQLEIAYRFDDRSRVGVAVSHYSNASLGDTNPGTESAILYYAVPLNKLTNLFD